MSSDLLIDNWTLQAAERLLLDGCDADESVALSVDGAANNSEWVPKATATADLAALLRLLTDVITRDHLLVDEAFLSTWGREKSPLIVLRESGIVAGHRVPAPPSEARALTAEIVEHLCVTPSLKAAQRENQESWNSRRNILHPPQSTIVWGAAGYLMRSHYLGLPYSGHPLRAVALEQTLFRSARSDVTLGVEQWLLDQRKAVFEAVIPGSHVTIGMILPPFVVEIIETSTSASDLITTALQYRDEYADLRRWLHGYQEAVERDDIAAMVKHRDVLRSVEDNVKRRVHSSKNGGTSLSVSLAFVSASLPSIAPLEWAKNKVGVRAALNRLVFSKRGDQSFTRLLRLFGEGSTKLGRRIAHELPDLL